MNVEEPPEANQPSPSELDDMVLYSVAQVARVFGVTPYTVRVWLNEPNGMRGIKVGTGNTGRWRVTKQEMVRFANDKFGGELPNG